jgi:hypothetical protein
MGEQDGEGLRLLQVRDGHMTAAQGRTEVRLHDGRELV